MTDDHLDPAHALAAIRQSRQAVTQRLDAPWTYDVAYGLLCGGLVATQALPMPYGTVGVAVLLSLLGVYVAKWRKRSGMWVNGFTPRRARWAAVGLALWMVAAILGGLYLAKAAHLRWAPLVMAALTVPVSIAMSRLWSRIYRQELERVG